MTENTLPLAGEAAQGTEPPVNDGGQGTGAPYADYLGKLPESVRPIVEPVFKEWDSGVTQKFQSIHQEYEPLKGYQDFLEQGYDPDTVAQAIQFVEVLNSDPERIYQALKQQFGYDAAPEGASGQPDLGIESDDYRDPRVDELANMTNSMAEIILAQQQAQEEAQQDAALDEYLNSLREQYGDYDEEYVLAKLQYGVDGEEAVKQYQALVDQALASRNSPSLGAPVVMGGGGGMPAQPIDPGKLSDKETKELVASILAAQANQ